MTLQALGDSFTCGEGVGVRVGVDDTWSALLAQAIGTPYVSYSVPGARAGDVLSLQVPQRRRAAVSTLIVGLNDVARPGFDATRVRASLLACVDALRDASDEVVVGRLADPTQVLRVPTGFRAWVRRRLAVVNDAVDEASRLTKVQVVDLAAVPELRTRAGWAVDRVHPSAAGHLALARAAASLFGCAHRLPQVVLPQAPTVLQRTVWKTRHGAPYLAGQLCSAVKW